MDQVAVKVSETKLVVEGLGNLLPLGLRRSLLHHGFEVQVRTAGLMALQGHAEGPRLSHSRRCGVIVPGHPLDQQQSLRTLAELATQIRHISGTCWIATRTGSMRAREGHNTRISQ